MTQARADKSLLKAAQIGDAEALSKALSLGANPNVKDYILGRTTLMKAVIHGHAECARLLLAAGVGLIPTLKPPGEKEWDQ